MSPNVHAPHKQNSNSFTILCSELEANNTGHLDFTNNLGVQDPLLQVPKAMSHESNQSRVKGNLDTRHNIIMEMAIKDLLAKGAVQEVKLRGNQFTSTLFLLQNENGDYRPVINLCALNRFLEKESFKMEGLQVVKSLIQ